MTKTGVIVPVMLKRLDLRSFLLNEFNRSNVVCNSFILALCHENAVQNTADVVHQDERQLKLLLSKSSPGRADLAF
jgi:hypothetical protein